jgi:hypothetical protein
MVALAASALALVALIALPAGCKDERKAAAKASAAKNAAKNAKGKPGAVPLATGSAKAGVAKIVFVGKGEACACTKKRIAGSWKTLGEVNAGAKKLPVEKLQLDTDKDKVAVYRKQKALITLPGVYLVDAQGKVLTLFQGQLEAEQLRRGISGS